MAGLVRKENKAPLAVMTGSGTEWICMCRLSANQPFCDGSHNKAVVEDGKTYVYNNDGTRKED